MSQLTLAFAGNPNCGKTALFNALTGSQQKVGNWPGVTVSKKTGHMNVDGEQINVVDLPGVYTLGDGETSLDERIARDYLLSQDADIIVNIIDASHLERHLVLTSRLLEYGLPVIIVANMMDVVKSNKLTFDIQAFSEKLNVPIIPTIASKREGIDVLRQQIEKSVKEIKASKQRPENHLDNQEATKPALVTFDNDIEQALLSLQETIKQYHGADNRTVIGISRQILEDFALTGQISANFDHKIIEKAEQLVTVLKQDDKLDPSLRMSKSRFDFARAIKNSVQKAPLLQGSTGSILDKFFLNKYLGVPLFFLVMYMLFMVAVRLGSAFIDLFDISAQAIFVDGFRIVLEKVHVPENIILVLADGFGSGMQTVLAFIPVVGLLFLVLAFLEDCGYLSRAAFVIDRLMARLGLPGKAFVPLITGFGCTVSAFMSSKTLDNHRDRLMTTAMANFMSCSARLPVYVFFAAAFFPKTGQNLVFSLYIIGIAMALATGFLLQKTILKAEQQPMIIELPRWHLPVWSSVLRYTWARLHGFLIRAGRIIIPMVALLTVLNSVTLTGDRVETGNSHSALATISKKVTPIFHPMGITQENWPATVGIITGILAKEVLVGSLNALYSQIDKAPKSTTSATAPGQAPPAFSLTGRLKSAVTTTFDNMKGLIVDWDNPLGIHTNNLTNSKQAAAEQGVSQASYVAMQDRFDGSKGALAFLLFVLFYMPCTSATAAMVRAQGWKWTGFVTLWTNGIAWISAVVAYQVMTFIKHPASSLFWIGFCLFILLSFIIALVFLSKRKERRKHPSSMPKSSLI